MVVVSHSNPSPLRSPFSITNCLKTVRPDIAEMWLKGGGNGDRTPDGVMASADGTAWMSWEGREWEVNLREVVSAEGRPAPPPLPVIAVKEEVKEEEIVQVRVEEKVGGEEEKVVEEEKVEEEESTKAKHWKEKFKSVLGGVKTAFLGFRRKKN